MNFTGIRMPTYVNRNLLIISFVLLPEFTPNQSKLKQSNQWLSPAYQDPSSYGKASDRVYLIKFNCLCCTYIPHSVSICFIYAASYVLFWIFHRQRNTILQHLLTGIFLLHILMLNIPLKILLKISSGSLIQLRHLTYK